MAEAPTSKLKPPAELNRQTAVRGSLGDNIFDIVDTLVIIAFLIIVIFPLYWVIIASFSGAQEVNAGKVIFFPVNLTINGYQQVFTDMSLWRAYKNTIIYTVLGCVLNVSITLAGGYALSRSDLPLRPLIMKLLIFTMFFNGGLIPTFLVVKGLGIYDTIWAVLLPSTLSVYNMTVARAFFQSSIPSGLEEAATIDGASNMRTFLTIVLPCSPAIISVLTMFHAVQRWNEYFNAMIYLRDNNLFPLQLYLRDILLAVQTALNMAAGQVTDQKMLQEMRDGAQQIKYGSIIISTLPMMILYPFMQKFFVKGVMVGSMKG